MSLRLALFAVAATVVATAQQPDAKSTATISGRTLALGGQPLRKATITLRPAGMARPRDSSMTSDADGNFTFEGIAAGRYQLWVERPGYLRQTYGAKRPGGAGSTLTVMPGQQVKDLVIELTPQGAIAGKVVDEDGDPVARSNVMAVSYTYANGKWQLVPRERTTTDDGGEYKVTALAPGRYYVVAGASGGSAAPPKPDKPEAEYVRTWYPSVTDAGSATPVDVGAGQTIAGTEIRLRRSQVVRIKGRVLPGTPDSNPHRLSVELLPREGFAFGGFHGQVANDGSFTVAHVPPGSYSIIATNVDGPIQVCARQPIDIGTHDIEDLVLTVQPLIELRGTVKMEGEPEQATSARVLLSPSDGLAITGAPDATAKDDGTFVFAGIVPGRYRVNAFATGPGRYVKAIRYGNQDVLATGIDLSQGAGGALQVLFSSKGAEVSGTVQADGQPVPAGTVTLIPDPPSDQFRYRQTPVDQNGQFSLRDVAPGDYRVYAWEDLEPGAQFDPEFLKPLEGQGTRISAGENGHERVTLTRISIAAAEDSRRRSGR